MDLLVILAIVWFIRQGVVDARYAALGKTPPRYQVKMAELAAAGKAKTQPRYGSRAYFADLWADSLEASTAKRRAKAETKKTEVREAELSAATDEAIAVAAPSVEPVKEKPEPVIAEPVDVEPTGPTAQIIPMFPAKKEVPTMSEITGLQSAIAYADAMAAAHDQSSLAGGEAYLGSLQGFEVSGQAIAMVAAAQEASQNAAGAWRMAAAELSKQNIVKEAYDSVPDAGSKVFVQGE
jgi:hypothetical protein